MDVKDRIAKLLALAGSSYESEAKAAMLKARELMAEHKLRPEMCERAGKEKVVELMTGVQVSKTKNAWAVDLSTYIASHYCCRSYRSRYPGKRMQEIGFVGFEEDAAICKTIFLYAYDCCRKHTEVVFRQHRDIAAPSYRRALAESYGTGFARGVRDALKRQTEEKPQEWGLVLVVPKAVDDHMASWKASVFNQRKTDDTVKKKYRSAGYGEGLKFDPQHRIGSGAAQLPSGN